MSHRVKLNKNILANGAVSTQPHWPIKSQNVVGERMSPWKVHIIISRDVKLFCSSKELYNIFGGGGVEEGVINNLFIFRNSGKVL